MPDIESAEPTKADMLKKNGLEKIRSTNSSRVEPSTLPHYSEAWAEDGGKEVVQIVEGKEVGSPAILPFPETEVTFIRWSHS